MTDTEEKGCRCEWLEEECREPFYKEDNGRPYCVLHYPGGAKEEQFTAALAKRLDRLSHQFERLERDQTILTESLALFIRYYLSITAPIAETHQEAARAQGKARFEKFIEQLAAHLQRGRSLVKDVHREIYPDAAQFHSEGTA